MFVLTNFTSYTFMLNVVHMVLCVYQLYSSYTFLNSVSVLSPSYTFLLKYFTSYTFMLNALHILLCVYQFFPSNTFFYIV